MIDSAAEYYGPVIIFTEQVFSPADPLAKHFSDNPFISVHSPLNELSYYCY